MKGTNFLHVVDGLDSQLVRGPVRAHRHGGEVKLLQANPVDGAGAGVLVPVSVGLVYEDGEVPHGAGHDYHPDKPVQGILSIHKVPDTMNSGFLHCIRVYSYSLLLS